MKISRRKQTDVVYRKYMLIHNSDDKYDVFDEYNNLQCADCGSLAEAKEFVDTQINSTEINKRVSESRKIQNKQNVQSASYGGAYDIADDQLFTRDDLIDFGDRVCEHLNEIFSETFEMSDVYIEGNELYIAVVCNQTEEEFSVSIKLDLRKFKNSFSLADKYALEAAGRFREIIETESYLYACSDTITGASTSRSALFDEVQAAVLQGMVKLGFEDEQEAAAYSRVDITQEDGQTRVEVRAELSYDGMVELSEMLNPVVAKHDPNAYFDMDEPGIMTAYLNSVITSASNTYGVPYEITDDYEIEFEINLDDDITVFDDTSWDFATEYPEWSDSGERRGDWHDEYGVYVGDQSYIVECVQDLIEPSLPSKPGEYHITGTVNLVFDATDIRFDRTDYPDDSVDIELIDDEYDQDVEFNISKSEVKKFNWVEI